MVRTVLRYPATPKTGTVARERHENNKATTNARRQANMREKKKKTAITPLSKVGNRRKPSEACIEATRKMFREGFNPLRVLKAKNPRKFKRSIEKRRDKWLEIRRRERARIIYGLPQKTKFHIVIQPLSHAASSQKYIMIKQNNYFSDPEHPSWVCYDSETTRSPRREATAIKHGLNIVAGE